jgi:hypothetical protein
MDNCSLHPRTNVSKATVNNETFPVMDKLQLTGQNQGRVFNFRNGRAHDHAFALLQSKTYQLKVENSAQPTFRLSPVRYCASHFNRTVRFLHFH